MVPCYTFLLLHLSWCPVCGRVGHRLFAGVALFFLTPGMALLYPVQARGRARFRLCKKHMVRGSSPWGVRPVFRKCGSPWAVLQLGSARFRLCKKHMARGSSPWGVRTAFRKCGLPGCGMGYSSRGREQIYRFSHLGKQNHPVGAAGRRRRRRRGAGVRRPAFCRQNLACSHNTPRHGGGSAGLYGADRGVLRCA